MKRFFITGAVAVFIYVAVKLSTDSLIKLPPLSFNDYLDYEEWPIHQ